LLSRNIKNEQIPPGGMDVCLLCCVLSGRGLCDELISRPEELTDFMCHCVRSRNIKNEQAIAGVGPQRHKNLMH